MWEDSNGDGVWDDGEPAAQGVAVNIVGCDASVAARRPLESGRYGFTVLAGTQCRVEPRAVSDPFPSFFCRSAEPRVFFLQFFCVVRPHRMSVCIAWKMCRPTLPRLCPRY